MTVSEYDRVLLPASVVGYKELGLWSCFQTRILPRY